MLNHLNLPPLTDRETMLELLQREEYGYLPPKPDALRWEREVLRKNYCAGKAVQYEVILTATIGEKEFSFPMEAVLPTAEGKHPFFVHIGFSPLLFASYQPTEELVDRGYAVLSFRYIDVTSDDGDFTNGLAGIFYPDGKRGPTDAGKIALWAWAAQRVMDYAETLGEVLDLSRATVCGHSRLGKTALFTAATDERFTCGYSNDSGCSGAAISRCKEGETIQKIYDKFPFWFCENYARYKDKEEAQPFDQHYLIASIAPRRALVGSAEEDAWADPKNEFLSCVAAAPAFPGEFPHAGRIPRSGETVFGSHLGYQLRAGTHYFSRHDWNRLIEFLEK